MSKRKPEPDMIERKPGAVVLVMNPDMSTEFYYDDDEDFDDPKSDQLAVMRWAWETMYKFWADPEDGSGETVH